jgi:hypothetical protein
MAFDLFLFHGAVGKTFCGGVVYLHWGWWVRVAQLGERVNDGHSVLAIQIASANFGFSGRANDDMDDFAHGMHRTIETRELRRWCRGIDRFIA